ncbi:MAG: hypothetical protein PHX18_08230 [Candidatus Gastranaerophilales bacterium]|nr:hypothetical protein [Candidatus Gastranaerophilales bacterium]
MISPTITASIYDAVMVIKMEKMNEQMHIFIPYQKNNEHHEDLLTRAFLQIVDSKL